MSNRLATEVSPFDLVRVWNVLRCHQLIIVESQGIDKSVDLLYFLCPEFLFCESINQEAERLLSFWLDQVSAQAADGHPESKEFVSVPADSRFIGKVKKSLDLKSKSSSSAWQGER